MFETRELTGSAFKSPEFVDYVARIAAYRDKVALDADARLAKRLDRLENEYMAARHRACLDYKEEVRRAHEEFERRQEATQRNVERRIEEGREQPSGRKMAAAHGAHINDVFEGKLK